MKGIAEARGAGIEYDLAVQNFPQLRELYREGWENLVSNSVIHAFGVTDNFTAEYLSKMTGKATVITNPMAFPERRRPAPPPRKDRLRRMAPEDRRRDRRTARRRTKAPP